jgi:hypothetical protein
MSDYVVSQAYDGLAAVELCAPLPEIKLLALNTLGSGIDLGASNAPTYLCSTLGTRCRTACRPTCRGWPRTSPAVDCCGQ